MPQKPLSTQIRDAVACPTCSSSAGVPCTERGGPRDARPVNWVHLERINYYARQQRLAVSTLTAPEQEDSMTSTPAVTVEVYDAEYGVSIERFHFDTEEEAHSFITREVADRTKPGHTYAMVEYSWTHNPDAIHRVEVTTPREGDR